MGPTSGGGALGDLRALLADGTVGGLTDGQLLERFVARRDGRAFEALVTRHGPMVWDVCRRALPRHQDAEDAFQATFFVLARRAASVRPREMLPNWLYGVARRTAVRARADAARRAARERPVAAVPEPSATAPRAGGSGLGDWLDLELSRLPDKYRAPLVLCALEGKGHREAAEQLGWPVGTLSGRLSRAKALLAGRLSRRGAVAGAAASAALWPTPATAGPAPGPLVRATLKAAGASPEGGAAGAGPLSPKVAKLVEGVVRAMLLRQLKAAAAVAAAVAVSLTAAGEWTRHIQAAQPGGPGRPAAVAAAAVAADPEPQVKVSLRLGGRTSELGGGQVSYAEGMAHALLGKTYFEGEDVSEQAWSKLLREDHLRITYPGPHRVEMTLRVAGFGEPFGDMGVEVTEIVLPMSAPAAPPAVLVRSGGRRRAFTKVAAEEFGLLRRFMATAQPAAPSPPK